MCKIILPGMENRFSIHVFLTGCKVICWNPHILINFEFLDINIKPHCFLPLQEKRGDREHFLRSCIYLISFVYPVCGIQGNDIIDSPPIFLNHVEILLLLWFMFPKVFVERFSRGLQAEYKHKGIIIQVIWFVVPFSPSLKTKCHRYFSFFLFSQSVAPFGVSTRMAAYQETNIVTLSPEDFVKSSLQYLRAGDRTHGSVCHIVLVRLPGINIWNPILMPHNVPTDWFVLVCVDVGTQSWFLQSIPLKAFYSESALKSLQDYVKRTAKKGSNCNSTSAWTGFKECRVL